MEIKNSFLSEKLIKYLISIILGIGFGIIIYIYQLIFPVTQSSFIQVQLAFLGCIFAGVIAYRLVPLFKRITNNELTSVIIIRILWSLLIGFMVFLIIDHWQPLPVGIPGEHKLEIVIPVDNNNSVSLVENYVKINEIKIGNEKIDPKRFEQIEGQFIIENQEIFTRMPGKLRYIYEGDLSTPISILISYIYKAEYNEVIVGVDGKYTNYFLPRGNKVEQKFILLYPPLFQLSKILYILSNLYFIVVVALFSYAIFSFLFSMGRKNLLISQVGFYLKGRALSFQRLLLGPILKNFENENKIDVLTLIIVIGFTCSVGYHYFLGTYLNRPSPQNTFLFNPGNRFEDFYKPVLGSEDLDPFRPDKIAFKGGYLPFGYLVSFLYSLIVPREFAWFVFISIFFLSLYFSIKNLLFGRNHKLNSHKYLSLFAIMFMTYPILFAVDRTNFDMLICTLIFLFVILYKSNKFIWSTVFLGMATAIKPFTGLFILIYLYDKKYKEALIFLINILLLTVLSLSVFKDALVFETQKFLKEIFAAGQLITGGSISRFASDLYNLVSILSNYTNSLFGREIIILSNEKYKLVYSILSIIIFIFFVLYLWIRRQPLWKTLLILSCLIVLLPYVTYDYRITYLFPPMVLFLKKNDQESFDFPITILWGILLIPKNYPVFGWEQNIGMLLNPILLLLIMLFTLFNHPVKRYETVSSN